MHNKRIIITGIIIFLILTLYPIWNIMICNGGKDMLQIEILKEHKECVMPAEYMKANHMTLLKEWRDSVIRSGDRSPVTVRTIKYEKSLTQTCLKCHNNKPAFCDKCHGYLSVTPSCWNCHYFPKEKKIGTE